STQAQWHQITLFADWKSTTTQLSRKLDINQTSPLQREVHQANVATSYSAIPQLLQVDIKHEWRQLYDRLLANTDQLNRVETTNLSRKRELPSTALLIHGK